MNKKVFMFAGLLDSIDEIRTVSEVAKIFHLGSRIREIRAISQIENQTNQDLLVRDLLDDFEELDSDWIYEVNYKE